MRHPAPSPVVERGMTRPGSVWHHAIQHSYLWEAPFE